MDMVEKHRFPNLSGPVTCHAWNKDRTRKFLSLFIYIVKGGHFCRLKSLYSSFHNLISCVFMPVPFNLPAKILYPFSCVPHRLCTFND